MAIKYIAWELLKYHRDESSVQIRIEQKMNKLGVNEGFVTVVFCNLKSIKYKGAQQEKRKTHWLHPGREHAAK